MFSYWQSRLTDDLLGRIHADDGILVNLASGEMTRHILKNRIADPATLRSFEWEGFRLDPALSKGDDWVFVL